LVDNLVHFNGLDGVSGSYLVPPATPEAISRRARGFAPGAFELDELRYWHQLRAEKVLAPAEGLDPCRLAEVGWGVVFAQDCDPAVREALRELLDHRRRQATEVSSNRYREFWGADAYLPGESKSEFLARMGAGPGPVDPERVPYYLLLVGNGRAIPFSLQYQLDVQYAVGRLSLDSPEDYRSYAAGVVAAETAGVRRARTLGFFGPQNPGDRATELSRRELVEPLMQRLAADHSDWQVRSAVGDDATKACLLDLVAGDDAPLLLFTAGHGVGWPPGHPEQALRQGALVCQEWAGPSSAAGFSDDAYVWAGDVPDDAQVHGLISFHFACFGAATPEWDDLPLRDGNPTPARLAPQPMVSALPRRLLGHPRGGALAVAGHVNRALGYSFSWPGAGRQTEVYRSCLERLLRGHPIGSAFDYVNQRYAELSTELSAALEDVKYGRRPDDVTLSMMWTASNDARDFVVLGDPAVRIPGAAPPDRPSRGEERIHAARASAGPDDPPAQPAHPAGATTAHEPPRSEQVAGARDAGLRLAAAAEKLAALAERLTDLPSVVEVALYSSEDPSTSRYEPSTGGFSGARLRALVRADLAGDLRILVGERDGALDSGAWALLTEALERAQQARRELLHDLGTSLGDLLKAGEARR
jgi:hypothetical protein